MSQSGGNGGLSPKLFIRRWVSPRNPQLLLSSGPGGVHEEWLPYKSKWWLWCLQYSGCQAVGKQSLSSSCPNTGNMIQKCSSLMNRPRGSFRRIKENIVITAFGELSLGCDDYLVALSSHTWQWQPGQCEQIQYCTDVNFVLSPGCVFICWLPCSWRWFSCSDF